MNRIFRIALLGGVLSLVACGEAPSEDSVNAPERPDSTLPRTPAPTPPFPLPTQSGGRMTEPGTNPTKEDPYGGTNDGYPDLTPTPVTPDIARTETGARAILLPWARGIELREFDQSWAMMGNAAKAQTSRGAFNAMFAPLHDLFVSIPAGTIEGAAGSSFYTVPTTVTGLTRDGARTTLKGEVVMRRVNDVPGATADQLAWHIERIDLEPS